MKKNSLLFTISACLCLMIFFLSSCKKEIETIEIQVDDLFSEEERAILSKSLDLNKFFHLTHLTQSEQYQVFLGRALFYDNHLSGDKSVACASCHQQELAFADNVALSRGANDNLTDRNSISLASFGSFEDHYGGTHGGGDFVDNSFFWDERTGEITEQLTQTLANPNEMGMPFHELGSRVAELEYAQILYEKAFGTTDIRSENVVQSIAAFVNRIESSNSSFDTNLQMSRFDLFEDFPLFSEAENNGKRLFAENCASCHAFSLSPFMRHQFDNLSSVASNGLEMEYADAGVGRHTLATEDLGVFKIPGLRNVALTAPYMHDGRFESLEDVMDFYSEGIQPHPNLDEKLKDENGNPKRMNFTDTEKAELVLFLKTLTGTTHLENPSLADPFRS